MAVPTWMAFCTGQHHLNGVLPFFDAAQAYHRDFDPVCHLPDHPHRHREDTGLERPPAFMARTGRRDSMSIRMPNRVLMRLMASAPSASTAWAMEAMSVTLGRA